MQLSCAHYSLHVNCLCGQGIGHQLEAVHTQRNWLDNHKWGLIEPNDAVKLYKDNSSMYTNCTAKCEPLCMSLTEQHYHCWIVTKLNK